MNTTDIYTYYQKVCRYISYRYKISTILSNIQKKISHFNTPWYFFEISKLFPKHHKIGLWKSLSHDICNLISSLEIPQLNFNILFSLPYSMKLDFNMHSSSMFHWVFSNDYNWFIITKVGATVGLAWAFCSDDELYLYCLVASVPGLSTPLGSIKIVTSTSQRRRELLVTIYGQDEAVSPSPLFFKNGLG